MYIAEAAFCSKVWWQGQARDSNALLFISGGLCNGGRKVVFACFTSFHKWVDNDAVDDA